MAGQEAAIGALGILILVGVFGRLFLKKTGFSDVFLLLLLGAAAGAFLDEATVEGMRHLLLPLGAVALLMIILDEGLRLSFDSLRRQAHKVLLFGFFSFFLSLGFVFCLAYFVFGMDAVLSLLVGAIFASVAPELLSGFLSGLGATERIKSIGELEAIFSDAMSVMLTLLIASAFLANQAISAEFLPVQIGFVLLLSLAFGSIFAVLWKAVFSKLSKESDHLLVIALGAVLYAVAGSLGANSVIAVFSFAFFVGNSSKSSAAELQKFQSEVSFFLRTFFFVYLGALLFHSPKPVEVGIFALAIALVLGVARLFSSRIIRIIEPEAKRDMLLPFVSCRGLTAAVLAVVVYEELTAAGIAMPIDLPLLALFVVFFTNLTSAWLVLKKGWKKEKQRPNEWGEVPV